MAVTLDLPHIVVADFLDLMRGPWIGKGASREVYEFYPRPEWVIKFEVTNHKWFQNVAEWDRWGRAQPTRWAKWFAPCHFISGCGTTLIQSRTKPLAKLPARVPSFFSDLKRDNWGEFEGRPVCHDYGVTRLGTYGLADAAMVKAEWSDDE
jgi:hypothetical protein